MERIPHIALLIDTARSYGRSLLRGVRRYVSEHEPWSVFMEPRSLESRVPSWVKHWDGDGILCRSGSQTLVNAVCKVGVPTVELRATRLICDFPFVGVDNASVGQMVAEHLIECEFRQFGVYEIATEDFFEQRCDNFVETVRRNGCSCSVFRPAGGRERLVNWEEHQEDLTRWIAGLPKPIGLMACTDQLGFWLLDACRRADVSVPEEAAVVGVENDESLCMMSSPPLSSVECNGERIGYEAAALLERMMAGEPAPTEPLSVKPLKVIKRLSSDIVSIEDKDLSQAVRFIRQNACRGIVVDDVVDHVAMSRSSLERKIQEVLGRSPTAEIRRVQLNIVKQLLTETDLPLTAIAEKTGFRHSQYLAEFFKRKVGETPGVFRASSRLPQK